MCFVFFCFCDTCNKYTSKCVEFFIFIISFLSFVLSIVGFNFMKRDHITVLCLILLLALILFSFIIFFSIGLILIFRYKQTINNIHNKPALVFSIIGLIITIILLICIISAISLIHTHYQEINHPCQSIERNEEYIKSINNLESQSMEEFCIHNKNYNINEVTLKEFIITYSFAISLLVLVLSLIYSWFNVYRRIKYLIDGSLHDFKIQENKKENNNSEEEDENYNNEENEENNKKVNNNYNDINNEFKDKNNILKKLDTNKNLEDKNSQDGITIYSNKNNLNGKIASSSNIVLTENNTEKITIKKKK